MLVLTRRIGEVIKIGDDIDVMIISINKNQIRLGITAPENIEVHREEIYNKIKGIYSNNDYKEYKKDV